MAIDGISLDGSFELVDNPRDRGDRNGKWVEYGTIIIKYYAAWYIFIC